MSEKIRNNTNTKFPPVYDWRENIYMEKFTKRLGFALMFHPLFVFSIILYSDVIEFSEINLLEASLSLTSKIPFIQARCDWLSNFSGDYCFEYKMLFVMFHIWTVVLTAFYSVYAIFTYIKTEKYIPVGIKNVPYIAVNYLFFAALYYAFFVETPSLSELEYIGMRIMFLDIYYFIIVSLFSGFSFVITSVAFIFIGKIFIQLKVK